MIAADTEWWTLIDGLRLGDHVLFWREASTTSDAILDAFLRGAIARNDLVAVILEPSEWDRLAVRLSASGVLVDRLASDGHVHALSAPAMSCRSGEPGKRIDTLFGDLATAARQGGRSGLSILTSCGGPAFSAGDLAVAEAIEGALHRWRRVARTLCLYEARDLYPLRVGDAYSLIRFHTHTLTAYGPGKIVAEVVPTKSSGPNGARSSRPRAVSTDA